MPEPPEEEDPPSDPESEEQELGGDRGIVDAGNLLPSEEENEDEEEDLRSRKDQEQIELAADKAKEKQEAAVTQQVDNLAAVNKGEQQKKNPSVSLGPSPSRNPTLGVSGGVDLDADADQDKIKVSGRGAKPAPGQKGGTTGKQDPSQKQDDGIKRIEISWEGLGKLLAEGMDPTKAPGRAMGLLGMVAGSLGVAYALAKGASVWMKDGKEAGKQAFNETYEKAKGILDISARLLNNPRANPFPKSTSSEDEEEKRKQEALQTDQKNEKEQHENSEQQAASRKKDAITLQADRGEDLDVDLSLVERERKVDQDSAALQSRSENLSRPPNAQDQGLLTTQFTDLQEERNGHGQFKKEVSDAVAPRQEDADPGGQPSNNARPKGPGGNRAG